MPRPERSVASLAERYRFAPAVVAASMGAGERLGKGPGSSLEFHDRRGYQAGDDIRHVDWRAFARTDQLLVRVHREEILPRIDLLLDGSRSMAVGADKAQLAADLAAFWIAVAQESGFNARLLRLGDRPELLEPALFEREGVEYDGRFPLAAALEQALPLLRGGTIRILISDLLAPVDAAALVRPLAARASGLLLLQVLGADDLDPPRDQALRLTDSETGATQDLVLDAPTLAAYRTRLARLQAALLEETRRAAGLFLSLPATRSLSELCKSPLAAEGVLVPA